MRNGHCYYVIIGEVMKMVFRKVVTLGIVIITLFSVFGMVGCSPRQLDPPSDFRIYGTPSCVFYWTADPRSPNCRVYVWSDSKEIF